MLTLFVRGSHGVRCDCEWVLFGEDVGTFVRYKLCFVKVQLLFNIMV